MANPKIPSNETIQLVRELLDSALTRNASAIAEAIQSGRRQLEGDLLIRRGRLEVAVQEIKPIQEFWREKRLAAAEAVAAESEAQSNS